MMVYLPMCRTSWNLCPKFYTYLILGDCAIEYIDLFDEGRYGAGKLFFRGRFKSLKEIAQQIDILLKMGSPTAETVDFNKENWNVITSKIDEETGEKIEISYPNFLAFGRYTVRQNIYEPQYLEKHPLDAYPYKAKYPLNIMLRFKFFNGFGYLNIGDKWGSFYDDNGDPKPKDEQFFPTFCGMEKNHEYILPELKVISGCFLSANDSEEILNEIKKWSSEKTEAQILNSLKEDDESYATDENGILSFDNSLLVL